MRCSNRPQKRPQRHPHRTSEAIFGPHPARRFAPAPAAWSRDSSALQRTDPPLTALQPVGVLARTFSIAPASVATAARVRVRFEGSRIRPPCVRPCASRSPASGRKSLTLLVITARSSFAATSRMTLSLLPTRSSRSATATTSYPTWRSSTAIARVARQAWPSRPQRLLAGRHCSPTPFVFGLVAFDLPVDLVAVVTVVSHRGFNQPGRDLEVPAASVIDPLLSFTVAMTSQTSSPRPTRLARRPLGPSRNWMSGCMSRADPPRRSAGRECALRARHDGLLRRVAVSCLLRVSRCSGQPRSTSYHEVPHCGTLRANLPRAPTGMRAVRRHTRPAECVLLLIGSRPDRSTFAGPAPAQTGRCPPLACCTQRVPVCDPMHDGLVRGSLGRREMFVGDGGHRSRCGVRVARLGLGTAGLSRAGALFLGAAGPHPS